MLHETPVLAERTAGTPFSTHRKTHCAMCCREALDGSNQPSFVWLISNRAPLRTDSRASGASVSSKQISEENATAGSSAAVQPTARATSSRTWRRCGRSGATPLQKMRPPTRWG